jgi:acetyl-CoA carboxylase carboxyl transferase subunit beta
MNWLTKAIKFGEKIKKVFKKRPSKLEIENSDWTNCCKGPILKKELEENLWVCNSCNKHHRISCRKRFDIMFGKNNYEILKTPLPSEDPLEWNDTKSYKERLEIAKNKTGQDTAVLIAKGNLDEIEVTMGAINFDFIGGSVGAAEGEAIIFGAQHAIENKTPFIFFPCGGGQRMFESPIALANMTRTTIAINELKKNNLPYIVCFTDPTAGGITASFAMLGDIHFAEPGCLIAFAGKRVIQATVKEELSLEFQTAEFVEKHGFVDKVINRHEIKNQIIKILKILLQTNPVSILNEGNETSENNFKVTKSAS